MSQTCGAVEHYQALQLQGLPSARWYTVQGCACVWERE